MNGVENAASQKNKDATFSKRGVQLALEIDLAMVRRRRWGTHHDDESGASERSARISSSVSHIVEVSDERGWMSMELWKRREMLDWIVGDDEDALYTSLPHVSSLLALRELGRRGEKCRRRHGGTKGRRGQGGQRTSVTSK